MAAENRNIRDKCQDVMRLFVRFDDLKLSDMKQVEVLMTIAAFAKAQLFLTHLYVAFSTRLREEIPNIRGLDLAILSNTLSKWVPSMEPDRLLRQMVPIITAGKVEEDPKCEGKHIVYILHAYAKRLIQEEELFGKFLRRNLWRIPSLDQQNFAQAVVSLTKIDRPIFKLFSLAPSGILPRLKEQSLIAIAYAYLHPKLFNVELTLEFLNEIAKRKYGHGESFILQVEMMNIVTGVCNSVCATLVVERWI